MSCCLAKIVSSTELSETVAKLNFQDFTCTCTCTCTYRGACKLKNQTYFPTLGIIFLILYDLHDCTALS